MLIFASKNTPMNILIIGAGGREHTFAWKLAQSPKCNQLFVAPGNAGTAQMATNLAIGVNDFEGIKSAVIENNIEMVVVGPEDPLVNGIHDFFLNDKALKSVMVIGPREQAAQLEGSKEFAKEFMKANNIPTAQYASFTAATLDQGLVFLNQMKAPYVLKADGLAAGKGVLIINDLTEAKTQLKEMLVDEKFGAASKTVVIEEFLDGIELSCFVLTDGKNFVTFPMAKDYKRIGEGDTGLNTGGMGAISPVPFVTPQFEQKIHERIVLPTIAGFEKGDLPFQGFVFIGLIKVGEDPYVIEYNVRMGDPETEVVLPLIKNDFVDLLTATAKGELNTQSIEVDERTATTVMLVSGGYPEAYAKGKVMTGLDSTSSSILFHAGTQLDGDKVLTSGGRVMAVTSLAGNFKEALNHSYATIENISFEGMNYRKDLGFDL